MSIDEQSQQLPHLLVEFHEPEAPKTVFLRETGRPDWELLKLLELTIERDVDGAYVSGDDVFMVYGVGPNETDAVKDYVDSLIEYFEFIEREAESYLPEKHTLLRLCQYLKRA